MNHFTNSFVLLHNWFAFPILIIRNVILDDSKLLILALHMKWNIIYRTNITKSQFEQNIGLAIEALDDVWLKAYFYPAGSKSIT